MEEIWKNIPEINECYFVSNRGNVKSIGRVEVGKRRVCKRKDKLLSLSMDTGGYIHTGLMVGKKQKRYLVHRLVAMAFIPNTLNKPFINHINGIKSDNRVENLEWVTRSENAKHSFAIGLQSNKGEKHPTHKITQEQADEIRRKFVPRAYSSRRLAAEYNLSKTNILDIVNYRIWNYAS